MSEQFGNGFEGLEERTLLAANVTAVLSGGTLTITGADSGPFENDEIYVYGDGGTGAVSINVSGATLKVNGVTDGDDHASFTGVKNIVFNGGAGDDYLEVYDLSITGNVTANGQAGYDELYVNSSFDDLYIGGNVSLTGEECEIFATEEEYGVTIVKNVTMTGGAGEDYLGIYNTEYGTDISIGGNVTMNGNGGSDDMEVGNYESNGDYGASLTVGGVVTMNGGAGVDYGVVGNLGIGADYGDVNVGKVVMNGGDGNDYMSVLSYGSYGSVDVTKGVVMNGGKGNDELGILTFSDHAEINVGTGVTIHGNEGKDTIGLYNVPFFGGYLQTIDITAKVELHGDQGDDDIGVLNNPFGSTIEMGKIEIQGWDGNDDIVAYGATVLGKAEIWGGNGDDEFDFFFNDIGGGGSFINGWFGYDELDQGGNTGAPVATAWIENFI